MKKLNNKGLTTIELLISFVLLAIIVSSLYGTVENYKNKQNIEEYKNKIFTYKNLLTREIQSDLIKKGLIDVKIESTPMNGATPEKYKVTFYYKDGSTSILETSRVVADDYGASETVTTGCPSGRNDKFMISYGTEGNMYDYPLPDLGEGKNDEECTIKDLRISSITISSTNNILTILINFYHPDFGNKYGINIITPINFNR